MTRYSEPIPEAVRNIVDKKLPCVFVSPHFDDAVFSLGSILGYLSFRIPVKVINVFTKAAPPPYTLSAMRYLYQCGNLNAVSLFNDRAKEDKQVLERINADIVNLGYTDALWRTGKHPHLKRFIGILPELYHHYPIFRFYCNNGRINPHDKEIIDRIEADLRARITPKTIVFAPLAIGNHVDHLIVRQVCSRLNNKVFYWSDYPYVLTDYPDYSFIDSHKLKPVQYQPDHEYKSDLIRGYRSQYKLVFPSGFIKPTPEVFYLRSK